MACEFYCSSTGFGSKKLNTSGLISIPKKRIYNFKRELSSYRANNKFFLPLKWNALSDANFNHYCALIDIFFKYNNEDHVHFSAISRHKKSSKIKIASLAQSDIVFLRKYYKIMKDATLHYHVCNEFHLKMKHETPVLTKNFQPIFNTLLAAKKKKIHTAKLVSVKKDDIMQLSQLLTSAINYAVNNSHLHNSDANKKNLMMHVQGRSKTDLSLDNSKSSKKISLKIITT